MYHIYLNKHSIWDKKSLKAPPNSNKRCDPDVIIIKRQMFVTSNFQIKAALKLALLPNKYYIWGMKNLMSAKELIQLNMVF